MAQRRFNVAIGYFKQALAIEPDSFDDRLSLGVAYSQNNNFEEAVLKATEQSRNREAMLKLGPSQIAEGLDAGLAALCIGAAR